MNQKTGAGYSGTPLLQKLGIKDGHHVAILDAPELFPEGLTRLPPSVTVRHDLPAFARSASFGAASRGDALDLVILFVMDLATLRKRFREAAKRIKPDGGLWVAWPKKSSGVATDVTEDRVREVALAARLVDNKVCAIDEIWSGLRCVYRRADRR